jgi:hypothetical protein
MKQNARYAFNALKAIGAPVFEGDWGGHFQISAELAGCDNYSYQGEKNSAPDGMPWADYYSIVELERCGYMFGVHPDIDKILERYELFCEWQNPAVLCVWDR